MYYPYRSYDRCISQLKIRYDTETSADVMKVMKLKEILFSSLTISLLLKILISEFGDQNQ